MRPVIRRILTEEVVTSDMIAEMLGIDPSGVRKLVMADKLDSVLLGNTRVYDREDVKDLPK